MYYLYLGRNGDFSSPKSIIIDYQDHYFYREENTDWFEMEESETRKMLSGSDNKYFSIEKEQFEAILSLWGGSRCGYQSMNIDNLTDNEGYGDEYE